MKFYEMGRGGEEIHFPEPTVFQESPWFAERFSDTSKIIEFKL